MPARTDSVTDPDLARALLLARRGQAYFSRAVRDLRDDEFDAPSLLAGWSRRHVVAHVGLNARALTRLTTWAATGVETPMYDSPAQRDTDIAFAATLPVEALRTLNEHAAVHLDVEWRDLPQDAWSAPVRTAQGRLVPAAETVWMRTREVWLHAVDLDHGARFDDFPPELCLALLSDVGSLWRRRAEAAGPGGSDGQIRMQPTDGPPVDTSPADSDTGDALVVRGRLADLTAWATGRGSSGVRLADGDPAPPAPRWL